MQGLYRGPTSLEIGFDNKSQSLFYIVKTVPSQILTVGSHSPPTLIIGTAFEAETAVWLAKAGEVKDLVMKLKVGINQGGDIKTALAQGDMAGVMAKAQVVLDTVEQLIGFVEHNTVAAQQLDQTAQKALSQHWTDASKIVVPHGS